MSKKRKALTQEEIWDDSELIDSWNEALEEYKYYHSLHARGEKVEDVLRQAQEDESQALKEPVKLQHYDDEPDFDAEPDDMADSEGEIHEAAEILGLETEHPNNADSNGTAKDVKDGHSAAFNATATPSRPTQPASASTMPSAGVPQAVAAGVQDEALKNLMMSWYYAGYYTGLYEGQRLKGEAESREQEPHGQVENEDKNG